MNIARNLILFVILFQLGCRKTTYSYSVNISEFSNNHELESVANRFTKGVFSESKGSVRTNAILVIYKDRIILEVNASEFNFNTLHPIWSISKFLLNGVLAEAVASQRVRLNFPVSFYLKQAADSLPNQLLVSHLLFFSSGLDWKERYEWAPIQSDILEVLYGKANKDMTEYISHVKVANLPGENISYSSGDSNLLSSLLASAVGKDYPTKFFRSMNISSFIWETDGRGVPIASSYAFLSPRDLAKIGQFYIREGWGKSSGLFPKNWIQDTFRIQPGIKLSWFLRWIGFPSMGGHVYLNRFDQDESKLYYSGLSPESFFASGHWGQYLVVDPIRKLVVIRYGNDRGGTFPMKEFLNRLVSVTDSSSFF
ncbi:hypothetical protein CH373_15525 [Leptospira perolatii]|uniref:Beta-lactamase-related domain-containing protein n=1 Tax=Leptospira perolatii TaxID=2023191 RepID=A0A2M9ZJC0_9LEPT|nr:serine hydrolase [Leptospira perolatii]PJZ68825.1 hypothetical protein CH360_13985 [Leptospira perolatii]PJZ72156.1 hypothetical protein CH373_15525 [Leptospira perolatii]